MVLHSPSRIITTLDTSSKGSTSEKKETPPDLSLKLIKDGN